MASEETPLVEDSAPRIPLDTKFNDDPKHITRARRLARYLSKFKWYYPHVDSTDENKPSLDAAWAYFEHVALGRHFLKSDDEKDLFQKAESGENEEPTRLYPVLKTPEADLADFGEAVGVYFFTLKALACIMLIAGLISLPNLIYYFEQNSFDSSAFSSYALQASAICQDQSWEACPTCTKEQWDFFPATYARYASAYTQNGTLLAYTRINKCEVTRTVAYCAYASLVTVVVLIYVLEQVTKNKEMDFDAAAQTATDYALEVENPPVDAKDPAEWKKFFEQFGRVTVLTIALDNEELTKALLSRREHLIKLANMQPGGVDVDPKNLESAVETALPPSFVGKLLGADAEKFKAKIEELEEKIAEYSKKTYPVSEVFVIFETEHAQRAAYKSLVVSGVDVDNNNVDALPRKYVFGGSTVLNLIEPPEPSSVRWMDLDESAGLKFRQRLKTSAATIVVIIVLCVLVVVIRSRLGVIYAAFAITGMNSSAPHICKYITSFEAHENQGSWESSLYVKITAIIWMTSTLITAFVSPFVNSLDDEKRSLIPSMYAIFMTELYISPLIELADISGNLKRHYLGPRAPDQRRMNAYFVGTSYQLSALYTDMTKVLFMTFYYSFIFPAGWLIASVTLAVHYWIEKFCLLRIWAPAPLLDNSIAKMSRKYFFTAALAVLFIVSAYNYATFPMDDACPLHEPVPPEYIGSFNATRGDNKLNFTITLDANDTSYKFCNQDMLRYPFFSGFPFLPSNQPAGSEWQIPSQDFTVVYGWTVVGVITFIVIMYTRIGWEKLRSSYIAPPQPPDKPHPEKFFSEVKEVFGYVPQAKVPGALFPTLLCDVSGIDQELVGWGDPSDPMKISHNAIYDLPNLVRDDPKESLFSIVMHYPPSRSTRGAGTRSERTAASTSEQNTGVLT